MNGASKDSATELGKLMHDFFCTDPDNMNYKELADKVRYYKEDEKGRNASGGRMLCADRSGAQKAAMCKVMEEMREETKIEAAKNLLNLGKLTIEEIANAIGLSIEKVTELAGEKGA